MKLKKIISLLAITGFGLTATGCSLSGSNNLGTASTIQLRIWRYNQAIDPLRDLIEQFQKDHSQVKINYYRKSLADFDTPVLKSLAARQGPDLMSFPIDHFADFQDLLVPLPTNFFFDPNGKCPTKGDPSNSKCRPVSDAVKTLFPPGIASAITGVDGKVYAIPSNVDSLILYYNPDLFSAALHDYRQTLGDNYTDAQYQPVHQLLSNPPSTWNDLLQQCQYITQRNGNTVTRATIALGTADNLPDATDILKLLMLQDGAQIISTDRKSALFHLPLTTPSGGSVRPGEKALDFYTSFANPGKANYSWNPSMPSALDAFGQGQLAMVIAYSDFGTQLKEKYPKFHPEVAAVPQISTNTPPVNYLRFSGEAVTQTADSPNAAFAFLQTYSDKATILNLAQEQHLQSPYLDTLQQNSDDFHNSQIISGQTVFEPNRNQFEVFFRQMIVDVSQNSISPANALDNGAQAINLLLQPPPTPSS